MTPATYEASLAPMEAMLYFRFPGAAAIGIHPFIRAILGATSRGTSFELVSTVL